MEIHEIHAASRIVEQNNRSTGSTTDVQEKSKTLAGRKRITQVGILTWHGQLKALDHHLTEKLKKPQKIVYRGEANRNLDQGEIMGKLTRTAIYQISQILRELALTI